MGKLVYGMSVTLDGYVNTAEGTIDFSAPDAETHRFINDRESRIGTYLFGRRMFETMRVWDDADFLTELEDYALEYLPAWQGADKVVYSTTLDQADAPRTRLTHALDVDAVRALKQSSARELAVGGPTLAAHFLRAGLVDELSVFVLPVILGGGTAFLPAGVRLDLTLLEERRFGSGTVFLRYAIRR